MPPRRLWNDRQIQNVIGNSLRFGVLAAALVVLLGGLLYLRVEGGGTPHYHVFSGESSDLRSLQGILASARSGSGRGIIQLGLVILIATPVARVFLSIFAFAGEQDWTYVLVTTVVLALLLYSLIGGA